MIYKEHKGDIRLVPDRKTEPDEWPLVNLPFDNITNDEWERFQVMINNEIVNLYNGKKEGSVNKQTVLQRLQRINIIFLNSLWSEK